MRKIVFLWMVFLLISSSIVAQTIIANPQDSNLEGGELLLKNSNSNYNQWNLDNRAGHFRIFHSGSVYFNITPNGLVGIGTNNPSSLLHLKNPAGGAALKIERGGKSWNFSIQNTGDNLYLNNSDNSSTFFTFRKDGKFGIGTTSPSVALDVSGTSKGIKLGDTNGSLLFRNNVGGANEIRSYGLPLEIETRDTQDISFNSNNGNSKLMTIKGDGSGIGIGTTSPSAKLEIKGAGDGVEILKLSTERPWVFKQEGTGASSNLVLQEISGNKFFKIKSYDNTDIYTIQSNSGNTYFKGNMGIGTANLNKKFQIRDGALMEMSLGTHQVNTGSKEPALFLSRWLGTGTLYQTHILHSLQSQGSYGLAFSLVGTHNHNDFSNYNTKMYLSQNGNLGIGTITPDAKLAVNGSVHAKEVKVDLIGWPDYVFENDYNLPTLQQVENHILEKGHLENIPSAAEVVENGIQLGEMNSKLLQKIEELTLYMIEQNKKTEELKILVTQQQKEIEILKNNRKKH